MQQRATRRCTSSAAASGALPPLSPRPRFARDTYELEAAVVARACEGRHLTAAPRRGFAGVEAAAREASTSRRRVLGVGVLSLGLAVVGETADATVLLAATEAWDGPSTVPMDVPQAVVVVMSNDDDFNYLEAVPTENLVATEANIALAAPLTLSLNTFGTRPAPSLYPVN